MPTASHRRHLVLSDVFRARFACNGAATVDVVLALQCLHQFSALRISRISNHVRSDSKYADNGWALGRAGRARLAIRSRNTKTIITRETVAHQSVAIREAAQEMLTSRVLSNMCAGNIKSRRQAMKLSVFLLQTGAVMMLR